MGMVSVPVQDPFGAVHDPAFPSLRAGLDPALVQDRFMHLGRLQGIRVLRLDAGQCVQVLYELDRVDHERVEVLATFRPGPVDQAKTTLLGRLRKAGFDERADVAVPESYGVIPEWGAVLERYVGGALVEDALTGAQGIQAARRAADALVRLQSSPVRIDRTHTIEDELVLTRLRLDTLAGKVPAFRARLEALHRAAETVAKALPPARPRLIHRTFDPLHVKIDGARTWVLGFERAAMGDPAIDAGRFLAHISELALRRHGDVRSLEDCERAFATSFVAGSDVAAAEALPIYSFFALARLLERTTQRLDRRAHTERLLAACEQRVEILGVDRAVPS